MSGISQIFVAPEVKMRKNQEDVVTPQADVYSLGAILYFLVVSDLSVLKNYELTLSPSGRYRFGQPEKVSASFTFTEPQW